MAKGEEEFWIVTIFFIVALVAHVIIDQLFFSYRYLRTHIRVIYFYEIEERKNGTVERNFICYNPRIDLEEGRYGLSHVHSEQY